MVETGKDSCTLAQLEAVRSVEAKIWLQDKEVAEQIAESAADLGRLLEESGDEAEELSQADMQHHREGPGFDPQTERLTAEGTIGLARDKTGLIGLQNEESMGLVQRQDVEEVAEGETNGNCKSVYEAKGEAEFIDEFLADFPAPSSTSAAPPEQPAAATPSSAPTMLPLQIAVPDLMTTPEAAITRLETSESQPAMTPQRMAETQTVADIQPLITAEPVPTPQSKPMAELPRISEAQSAASAEPLAGLSQTTGPQSLTTAESLTLSARYKSNARSVCTKAQLVVDHVQVRGREGREGAFGGGAHISPHLTSFISSLPKPL